MRLRSPYLPASAGLSGGWWRGHGVLHAAFRIPLSAQGLSEVSGLPVGQTEDLGNPAQALTDLLVDLLLEVR